MNVLLVVAYEGTCYSGFQRQGKGERTIQGLLEEALQALLGQPVAVVAAGRTDAGVHAEAQAVGFRAGLRIPLERLPYALNTHLPRDVVVRGARAVPDGFHPRFDAIAKAYRYTLWRAPLPSPFWRRYSWHQPLPLDLEAMRAASRALLGRHDFRAFAGAGRVVHDTVRTLHRADWLEEGDLLSFYVGGDGFLYKMVRTLVGTLVEVGRGVRTVAQFETLLEAQDRRQAGPTAPSEGLCLIDVEYASFTTRSLIASARNGNG